jgi:hypothetical protein
MVIPPGVKRTSILGATSVGQLVKIVYGERGKEEQYVPTDEQLANFNNLGERVGKIIADEGQDLRTVMGYWGQLETIGDSYIKNGGRNLEILWCPADADYATRNYVDRADEIARRHGEKVKLIECRDWHHILNELVTGSQRVVSCGVTGGVLFEMGILRFSVPEDSADKNLKLIGIKPFLRDGLLPAQITVMDEFKGKYKVVEIENLAEQLRY